MAGLNRPGARSTVQNSGQGDQVNDLQAPYTGQIRATSPRSESLSLPASRSRSPSSSFTRESPSIASSSLPPSAEMDLEPQVASLSMGLQDGGGQPTDLMSVDDHTRSSSTDRRNTIAFPPPRRKELFVDTMPDDLMLVGSSDQTSMNGSGPKQLENIGPDSAYLSDVVKSGVKRKRKSSDSVEFLPDEEHRVDSGQAVYSEETIHPGQVSTPGTPFSACAPHFCHSSIEHFFSTSRQKGQGQRAGLQRERKRARNSASGLSNRHY